MNNSRLLLKVKICGLQIKILKLINKVSPHLSSLFSKYITGKIIKLGKEYLMYVGQTNKKES